MDSKLIIPVKINRWAEERPELAGFIGTRWYDALIKAYDRLNISILYKSNTHGLGHIERTMLFGALLCMDRELDSSMTDDVLLCCSYHDIGRIDDRYDEKHGKRSAEAIAKGELRKLFSEPEAACAAIHAHAIPDARMLDTMPIYGVKDRDTFLTLAKCLKDADGLDRVRIFDLDESHLRCKRARELVPLAEWVFERYIYIPTVLCYGDSNTYGYNPYDGGRYPSYMRWPDRLQQLLGDRYRVIPEGLVGRTVGTRRKGLDWLNGMFPLESVLKTHIPVDVLIIMLGTNDCDLHLNLTAEEITANMEKMIVSARSFLKAEQGFEPRIILVAPKSLSDSATQGPFALNLNERSVETSRRLPGLYASLAKKMNCDFTDLENTAVLSEKDGLHMAPFGGGMIARKLAEMF